MSKLLFGLILAVILVGCSSKLSVKMDLSTADELPKSIALDYLNKNTEEFRALNNRYRRYASGDECVFTEAGFYKAESGPGKIVQYDQSVMELNYFSEPGTFYRYDIVLKTDSGFPYQDCTVDWQAEKEKEPPKFFTKIPTALKSLGVKVEHEK